MRVLIEDLRLALMTCFDNVSCFVINVLCENMFKEINKRRNKMNIPIF